MDWLVMITAGAVVLSAVLARNMLCLKKDVSDLVQKLEEGLDEIASGREFLPDVQYEDTLWAKVCGKLWRASTVWKKKGEEAQKEKEQIKGLISDISHQSKTPIANLKVYLEILSDEILNDGSLNGDPCGEVYHGGSLNGDSGLEIETGSREILKRLETETDKLDFLMQSMVKMSRLETGILCLKKERRNLFQTLRAAIAAVVPKAEKKQIQISVDCPDPVYVCHDAKWTQEALFNILENAVKYTAPHGEVAIRIVIQEVYVKISVKDNGRGIAPQRQAEIFRRFYREPEVHEQEGIGIGLYLARMIIELQGGYIEVYSDGVSGSDFQIYLHTVGEVMDSLCRHRGQWV